MSDALTSNHKSIADQLRDPFEEMSLSLDADIRVEFQPTNPPTPIGFGVLQGDKLIAVLSYAQLQGALVGYEAALAVRYGEPTKGNDP
jgi:hypothetical protein